jgi:two-component system cell cycle sensor histidine kinase/response regulator CckA
LSLWDVWVEDWPFHWWHIGVAALGAWGFVGWGQAPPSSRRAGDGAQQPHVLALSAVHDLNKLIGIILVAGEAALAATDKRSPAFGHLEALLHSTRLAAALCRRSLARARPDATPPPAEARSSDAVAAIRDAVRLSATLRTAGPRVRVSYESSINNAWVEADPILLRRALLNLVSNAVDASKERESRVLISVRAYTTSGHDLQVRGGELPAGNWWRVQVRDQGSGIPEAVQNTLFTPFESTKAPDKGTGLGLVSVVALLADSGGHVAVSSLDGSGTSFSLFLPATPEPAPMQAPNMGPWPPAQGQPGLHGRVLVVDDDAAMCRALERLLTRTGYVVECAHSVQAAVQRLGEEPKFRAIISDQQLQDGTGLELLDIASMHMPDAQTILMSGVFPTEGLPGRVTFLQKPFSTNDLVRVLSPDLHARVDRNRAAG